MKQVDELFMNRHSLRKGTVDWIQRRRSRTGVRCAARLNCSPPRKFTNRA